MKWQIPTYLQIIPEKLTYLTYTRKKNVNSSAKIFQHTPYSGMLTILCVLNITSAQSAFQNTYVHSSAYIL